MAIIMSRYLNSSLMPIKYHKPIKRPKTKNERIMFLDQVFPFDVWKIRKTPIRNINN